MVKQVRSQLCASPETLHSGGQLPYCRDPRSDKVPCSTSRTQNGWCLWEANRPEALQNWLKSWYFQANMEMNHVGTQEMGSPLSFRRPISTYCQVYQRNITKGNGYSRKRKENIKRAGGPITECPVATCTLLPPKSPPNSITASLCGSAAQGSKPLSRAMIGSEESSQTPEKSGEAW